MRKDLKEEPMSFRWIEALEKKFGAEKHFKIDARCIGDSPKAFYYFGGESGLNSSWGENKVFLQLPTHNSKLIKLWLAKAFREGQRKGCSVWVFVPRFIHSNSYYSEYLMKAKRLVFIEGRMPLEDGTKKVSSPCVFLEFDGRVLGGPSVYTLKVKEVIESTTEINSKEHLFFELKKRAELDPYESLSKAIKPIQINRNDIEANEALFELDKKGALKFTEEPEALVRHKPTRKNLASILDALGEEDLFDTDLL